MVAPITDEHLAGLWDTIASRRLARAQICAAVRAWRTVDNFNRTNVTQLKQELDEARAELDDAREQIDAERQLACDLQTRLDDIARLAS